MAADAKTRFHQKLQKKRWHGIADNAAADMIEFVLNSVEHTVNVREIILDMLQGIPECQDAVKAIAGTVCIYMYLYNRVHVPQL